jgi:hypothetical protein
MTSFIEIIFIYVFSYPGAFLRWLITGCKKGKVEYYLKKDSELNAFVFYIFFGLIVLLVKIV